VAALSLCELEPTGVARHEAAPIPSKGGRTTGEDSTVYVGFDVSKAKHAVAIAESGRTGEVRYFGEIDATPAAVERFVCKLEKKHQRLHVCGASSRSACASGRMSSDQ
jgi:hypothetical protein